jgi:hypothetical protein
MPYRLSVALYNQAGERVRLLYEGPSSASPEGHQVSGGAGEPLYIGLMGVLADGSQALVWDQRNDGGQAVAGGTYHLKMEATDSWGQTSAYTRAVQVLAQPSGASLVLYNSAGEAVRHYDAAGLGLDPVDLGRIDGRNVELKDRHGGLGWFELDGLSDAGQPLKGGSYQLVLHWADSSGDHTVARPIVVVPAPMDDLLRGAGLEANPVPAGQALVLRHRPCACQVTARLYTLAGELAGQGSGSGDGRLELGLSRASGGVYLIGLEARAEGQPVARRVIKAAVLR